MVLMIQIQLQIVMAHNGNINMSNNNNLERSWLRSGCVQWAHLSSGKRLQSDSLATRQRWSLSWSLWTGLNRIGLGLVWSRHWFGLDWSGLYWTGLGLTELDWTELKWTGLDCLCWVSDGSDSSRTLRQQSKASGKLFDPSESGSTPHSRLTSFHISYIV